MMGAQHKAVGVGFGIALFMYSAATTNDPYSGLALVGSTIGCMLPDIDHDRTRIGRKRAFVTRVSGNVLTAIVSAGIIGVTALLIMLIIQMDKPESNTSFTNLLIVLVGLILFAVMRTVIKRSKTFRWMTKHRGLMHTLLMPAILLYATTISAAPIWKNMFIGLAVGYCSHLFADMLTVEGCPVLFPFSRNNIRIMRLETISPMTSVVALILAVLPVVAVYYLTGGF